MKKIKNEKVLLRQAIVDGMRYAELRGEKLNDTQSLSDKIEYLYRLLVHDNLIQPIPESKVSQQSMKHKLAIWGSKL